MLILHSIDVSVQSICFTVLSAAETGPYKALIKDISVGVSLSDPKNALHKEHIGSREQKDPFDLDAYALKITLGQITLERDTLHHTMRLARIGQIELQTLIFQWPAPFLNASPFMRNDANASLLALHLKLASIHLTDRAQDLQALISMMESREKKPQDSVAVATVPQPPKPPAFPMPRLAISVECGPIIARVIYDAENGEQHRAIEMRNNGFVVMINSEYRYPTVPISRFFPAASSVQSLHWNCAFSFHLEPILIRVRSEHEFVGTGEPNMLVTDPDFLDDPPVVSIGGIEVQATANGIAQIDGAAEAFAIIDKTSLIADLSIAFESICVELWHPIAVDATLRIVSMMPPKVAKEPKPLSKARFLNLPVGLSAKAAISRFVVFITAPDISPNDNLELSRGFSLRTSVAAEYCSLRSNQVHWVHHPHRLQNRAKLRLVSEPLPDAIVAARSLGSQDHKSAFIRLRVTNLVFKDAVATQFEPAEPEIVGREDLPSSSTEVLRISNIQMNVCLSCKPSPDSTQYTDYCEVSAQVPSIRVDFKLVHAYSILLGLQTIRILNPPRPPPTDVPVHNLGPELVLTVQGNITSIQALVTLPHEKLFFRMDALHAHMSSGGPPRIKWTKAALLISLPPQSARWETPVEGMWDEFVSLQAWELGFTPIDGSLCISVDGDSARIHIPHGFILANLLQDISVSAKAIKHIAHMASTGCYSEMGSPEAEGPKSVPHLTIRLGYLCVEAQDDPFESKLGLIWQEGVEASKQRRDREEAFNAKVVAIMEAEPELSESTGIPKVDSEQDYQFSAKHSISITEARKRLDDVHSLDWHLRLEKGREQRSKFEDSIRHKLYGTSFPTAPNALPDFIKMPPPSSNPPLLRAMLQNLCLIISPPSFTMDQLPDVMNNFGSGLPRDTEFSLLVPLHIHFTLSSLRATLRDYPLPLIYIPAQANATAVAWTFDTDLIIGEEMGTELSVDWVQCPIIEAHQASHGEAPFSISVPKTIMPVKTYAQPVINISTPESTTLSWGVSFTPAIQDLMRIVETLSSAPRDPSPSVGFWDKVGRFFSSGVCADFITDAFGASLDSQSCVYW